MTTTVTERGQRLVEAPDPATLLYGAVVAASVLATGGSRASAFTHVGLAVCEVLGIYWLAHVYIEAQALQVAGDPRGFLRRLGHTFAREAWVIAGGLPAVAVYYRTHAPDRLSATLSLEEMEREYRIVRAKLDGGSAQHEDHVRR